MCTSYGFLTISCCENQTTLRDTNIQCLERSGISTAILGRSSRHRDGFVTWSFIYLVSFNTDWGAIVEAAFKGFQKNLYITQTLLEKEDKPVVICAQMKAYITMIKCWNVYISVGWICPANLSIMAQNILSFWEVNCLQQFQPSESTQWTTHC